MCLQEPLARLPGGQEFISSAPLHVCPAGFSWKGQTAAITQLLSVVITKSPDPSQELLSLVNSALAEMSDKVPSKEQLNPVAGFAALCSATFATWYK